MRFRRGGDCGGIHYALYQQLPQFRAGNRGFSAPAGAAQSGAAHRHHSMAVEDQDLAQSVRETADLIRYVHFSDSNRRYPRRGEHRLQVRAGGSDGCGLPGLYQRGESSLAHQALCARRGLDYIRHLLALPGKSSGRRTKMGVADHAREASFPWAAVRGDRTAGGKTCGAPLLQTGRLSPRWLLNEISGYREVGALRPPPGRFRPMGQGGVCPALRGPRPGGGGALSVPIRVLGVGRDLPLFRRRARGSRTASKIFLKFFPIDKTGAAPPVSHPLKGPDGPKTAESGRRKLP